MEMSQCLGNWLPGGTLMYIYLKYLHLNIGKYRIYNMVYLKRVIFGVAFQLAVCFPADIINRFYM